MTDEFRGQNSLMGPLTRGFGITPSDTADLPFVTRQVFAATAGNVAVVWLDGTETVEPIAAGERVDWRIRRIKASGTTAAGLRGYA